MKFKSPVYSQASGSIAGLTYSHNRGGMYARARSTPTNPNTDFQVRVKAAMAQVSSHWVQELTSVEREAWDVYAAQVPLPDSLGELRNIGGIGHFNRTNVMRVQNGLAIIEAAPLIFDLGSFTPLSIDTVSGGVPGTVDLTFANTDDWAGAAAGKLFVNISRPQNPTINFFKGPFRSAGFLSGAATPPTSPETFSSDFAYDTGQRMFIQYRIQQGDGRTSLPLILVGDAT